MECDYQDLIQDFIEIFGFAVLKRKNMTNESLDNISQKEELVGDERAPLLSTSQDEEARYSRFHGASFHGSVFNLVCTIVGSGIMSLPATLKVLGLVLGAALSYVDLMGDAFGRIGKILLQVCVIINNIGVLIVYLIIIGVTSLLSFILYAFT